MIKDYCDYDKLTFDITHTHTCKFHQTIFFFLNAGPGTTCNTIEDRSADHLLNTPALERLSIFVNFQMTEEDHSYCTVPRKCSRCYKLSFLCHSQYSLSLGIQDPFWRWRKTILTIPTICPLASTKDG